MHASSRKFDVFQPHLDCHKGNEGFPRSQYPSAITLPLPFMPISSAELKMFLDPQNQKKECHQNQMGQVSNPWYGIHWMKSHQWSSMTWILSKLMGSKITPRFRYNLPVRNLLWMDTRTNMTLWMNGEIQNGNCIFKQLSNRIQSILSMNVVLV